MKTKLIAPCGMNCAICWLFSGRKTGVMDVGHRKENAINTAQFVHVFTGKGSTVLIVIFFPVKDSGSWTHDTEKTIA